MAHHLRTISAALLALLVGACTSGGGPPAPARAPAGQTAPSALPAGGVASPQPPGPVVPAPASRGADGQPVNGRLAPVLIQKEVRAHYGTMRTCYEDGLRANLDLKGRVVAKFVIDRNGAVAMVADGGSTMPDPQVIECVLRAFAALKFPQPEGGMVTVVYPIQFNPGD
jgi:hypothetical protein